MAQCGIPTVWTFPPSAFLLSCWLWVLASLCACNPVPARCSFPPAPSTQSSLAGHRGEASEAAALFQDIASIAGEMAAPPSGGQPHVPDFGSVNAISTCPWHYEAEEDVNRFPQRILRANLTYSEGSYGFCLKKGPSGWELSDLICIPIIRHMHVLRCSVTSDQPFYSRELLAVPIAFTCAFIA